MQRIFGNKLVIPKPSALATELRNLGSRLNRALVLAISLAPCLVTPADAQDNSVARTPSGDQAPMPAVRLLEVDTKRLVRSRSFFGRVSARETTELSFEVKGRLIDFSVREGTRLERGDVVARLDAAPFERAVRRAKLNLEKARREQKRAEKLAKTRAGTAVRAEDTATAADLAKVALADAREDLEDTVLVAPFDALVSKRIGTEFSNITPGQAIVSLHDMSEVRVEIDIPERVFLSVADPGIIAFEGELPNGKVTVLSLAEFEAQTGPIGQSFRVALVIPPEDATGLIPGASMTVHAALPMEDAGAALPASAILSASDRAFEVMVFVPTSGDLGVIERRAVELNTPGGTAFRALGLKNGELIVSVGGHLLAHGQTVRRYDGLVVEEK